MTWPRLTEQLRVVGAPWGLCLGCGSTGGQIGEDIHAWQEHDDQDQREPRAVVLCEDCSEEIIEPHPRLYRKLHEWEPMPGVMDLCEGCTSRDGYLCTHPDLTINGGEGLQVTFPEPTRAHVDGRDSRTGQRFGRWEVWWKGPPTDCAGREEVEP